MNFCFCQNTDRFQHHIKNFKTENHFIFGKIFDGFISHEVKNCFIVRFYNSVGVTIFFGHQQEIYRIKAKNVFLSHDGKIIQMTFDGIVTHIHVPKDFKLQLCLPRPRK